MQKLILLATFVVLGLAISPAKAQRASLHMQSGNDALSTCSAMDDGGKGDTTTAIVCVAWVNGAVQGAIATVALDTDKPAYCTPEVGGSTGQYADIFVKFLRAYPEKRHLPAIYLFHQAMAQAFPCRSHL